MTYQKGVAKRVNRNFMSTDFDCRCDRPGCATTVVSPTLAFALDELWDMVGKYKINSGYRCRAHNYTVGGKEGSKHLTGEAVDIESLKNLTGPEMARCALRIKDFEKGGLGVAEFWIHVDVRLVRARWTYSNDG